MFEETASDTETIYYSGSIMFVFEF